MVPSPNLRWVEVTMMVLALHAAAGITIEQQQTVLCSLAEAWNYAPWLSACTANTTIAATPLEALDMRGEALTGTIPASIGDLTDLTSLSLDFNALSGSLPQTLTRLQRLRTLTLAGNQLRSLSSLNWSALSLLLMLQLQTNLLTGTVPSQLARLSGLHHLDLGHNDFTGQLPQEFTAFTALSHLDLSHNLITGSLPPAYSGLISMASLSVNDNELTGPLPPEYARLRDLHNLSLGNNALKGTVPSSFSALLKLTSFTVKQNGFTGPFPPVVRHWSSLKYINIANNKFTGSFADNFHPAAPLDTLSAEDNAFTGAIPPELGQWPQLGSIRLQGNAMSGTIPPEYSALSRLSALLISQFKPRSPSSSSGTLDVHGKPKCFVLYRRCTLNNKFPHEGFLPGWLATENATKLQVLVDHTYILGRQARSSYSGITRILMEASSLSVRRLYLPFPATGGPFLPASTRIAVYHTPYASRFPCLLSIMKYWPAGALNTNLCQYPTTPGPSVNDTLLPLQQQLCSLAKTRGAALTTNWHARCPRNAAGEILTANHTTVTVDESWTGVYFLQDFIGLHLRNIGLQGIVSQHCDASGRTH